MNFRTSLALPSLLLGLMLSAFAPARAALVDELREVTRLHRAGQSSAALQRADMFLSAQPKDAQMRFLKAVVLADIGRRGEAIAMLQAMTEDFPELAEPHNNLAALAAAAGDYGKARAELEESLRLNPGYATAHQNIGDVYAMLASQSYGRALALEPDNPSVPRKLALVRQLTAPVAGPLSAASTAAATHASP